MVVVVRYGPEGEPSFRARIVRTLDLSPRLAHERFWIDGERNPWDAELDFTKSEIIGIREIDVKVISPMLLWDEAVGCIDDLDHLRATYFDGNTAAQPSPPRVLHIDTRELDPLDEGEFWEVLASLGGRMWEKTLDSAVRHLALKDESFVLRWAETAARKARDLGEAFRAGGRGDLLEQFGLSNIGIVIGKGRDSYESIVSRPSLFETSWATDHSSSVIFLGQLALDRQRGPGVWVDVETSFTDDQRLMLEADSSRRDEASADYLNRGGLGREEVDGLLGESPSQEAILEMLESNDLSAAGRDAAMAALNLPPQLRRAGLSSEGGFWRGIRSLIHFEGKVNVRIALASAPSDDWSGGWSEGVLESFGGTVCSPIEIDRMATGHPMNSDFFTIKRRFSGTRDEYLARHVNVAGIAKC